mmetsp:Transcript_84074/g.163364  ORF Transcript_84074/g.163364 Transcript_84074/m.163364 type:complete len:319 (+) Transcript_84074:791-1747(+)
MPSPTRPTQTRSWRTASPTGDRKLRAQPQRRRRQRGTRVTRALRQPQHGHAPGAPSTTYLVRRAVRHAVDRLTTPPVSTRATYTCASRTGTCSFWARTIQQAFLLCLADNGTPWDRTGGHLLGHHRWTHGVSSTCSSNPYSLPPRHCRTRAGRTPRPRHHHRGTKPTRPKWQPPKPNHLAPRRVIENWRSAYMTRRRRQHRSSTWRSPRRRGGRRRKRGRRASNATVHSLKRSARRQWRSGDVPLCKSLRPLPTTQLLHQHNNAVLANHGTQQHRQLRQPRSHQARSSQLFVSCHTASSEHSGPAPQRKWCTPRGPRS